MKTLLIIAPGREATRDSVFNLLVAETGEHLASHLCSHYGFAKSDLYSSRKDRVEEYEKRFGEVEVKYIDETDITEEQLIEINKDWYSKISVEKES